MQCYKQRKRDRVVIRRVTPSQIPQDMFVDEVKPKESSPLRRMRSACHQASGILQPGSNVPRRCNEQEQDCTAEKPEIAEHPELPGNEQIHAHYDCRERDTNHSLRQHSKSGENIYPISKPTIFA